MPKTATSGSAGRLEITTSTSAEYKFSPPVTIMSFSRSSPPPETVLPHSALTGTLSPDNSGRHIGHNQRSQGAAGNRPRVVNVIRDESVWGRRFMNHAFTKAGGLPFSSDAIAFYFQRLPCKRD
jgi:hypothetical protein